VFSHNSGRRRGPYRFLLLSGVLGALALTGCTHDAPSSLAQKHMIAAANPHAARAGRDILRKGGSAVDAVIAAQMVLTLVEPQSSGIGGGAFLLHYAPPDTEKGRAPVLQAYDGRETAPTSATENLLLDESGKPIPFRIRQVGGRGVGVPGLLRMLEIAHRAHGRLPWKQLFAPAIKLAESGFKISPRLHRMIARDRHLRKFPVARRFFFTENGDPRAVGTTLRNPRLAATLRTIADNGADAFYTGTIARDIARAVSTAEYLPTQMTIEDIAAYRAKERAIICRPYRVWRVCVMPPPTSGGTTTLQILAMLERFDFSRIRPGSAQAVHLIAEASRLAFADRDQYLADPDFVDIPVTGLLNRDYLDARGRNISADRSMGKAFPGAPPRLPGQTANSRNLAPDDGEQRPISTSHISVVDGSGNAVSMTTTVGMPFGSRLMVGGFMLNDQLTDFSPRPEHNGQKIANRPGPGKRPRSSMSPTIVTDATGNLVLTIGSPGGSSIIGYVTKTLIGALDWKLTIQEAISLPNFINRNRKTELEKGTSLEQVAPALRALGHEIRIQPRTSGLHGIRVRPGGLEGGADPRREGVALGD
jgi:gamma-glutamyltranspeptidase / glutathione hydrolase